MNPIEHILNRFSVAADVRQTAIGSAIGVNQGTVSRWKGGQKPTPENWEAFRAFAKQHDYYVPALEDALHPNPTVKLAGYIGAGAQVIPFDSDNGWDSIELSDIVEDGSQAAIVRGTSMLPIFEDGDLVGFGNETLSPEQAIGRLCVVFTGDGKMYIKIVMRGSKGGLYTLMSTNSESIPDVELQWARPFKFRIARGAWRTADIKS